MSVGTVKSALSVRSTNTLGVVAPQYTCYYYPEGTQSTGTGTGSGGGEEVQVEVYPSPSQRSCTCACRGRGAPSSMAMSMSTSAPASRWGPSSTFPVPGLIEGGVCDALEAEMENGFSNLDFTDLRDPFASSPPRRRSGASVSTSASVTAGGDLVMVDGLRVQRSRTRMSAWGRLPLVPVCPQQQQQNCQQQVVPGGVGLKKSLRRKGRMRSGGGGGGGMVGDANLKGGGEGEGMMTIQDSAMLAERLLVQLGAERPGCV